MMPWWLHPSRHLSLLWLVVLLVSLGWCGYGLVTQGDEGQFLSLLPKSSQEGLVETINFMTQGPEAQKVVIAFGHQDPHRVRAALSAFKEALLDKKDFLREESSESFHQWQDWAASMKSDSEGYLSLQDRYWLLNNQGDKIFKRVISKYMGPMGLLSPFEEEDPFGLYESFIKELMIQARGDFSGDSMTLTAGDLLKEEDRSWIFFKGDLQGDPFGPEVQGAIEQILDPLLDDLKERFEIIVLRKGPAFFALKGMAEGRQDMEILGTLSLVGTILLLFLAFGTWRPILFGCVVMSSGLCFGLGVTFLCFDKIYLIALIFATALIGISIDYALHYTCAWMGRSSSQGVLASLYPALPLGLVTSVLGYGLLIGSPVAVVSQMATIGAVGLIGAFVTVWLWGRYFIKPLTRDLSWTSQALLMGLQWLSVRGQQAKLRHGVVVLCVGLGFSGWFLMVPQDQLRNFQELNKDLRDEKVSIDTLLKTPSEKVVWFVGGETLDELLERQESMRMSYDHYCAGLGNSTRIQGGGFYALSRLLPSQKRRYENKVLVQERLIKPYGSSLENFLSSSQQGFQGTRTQKTDAQGENSFTKPKKTFMTEQDFESISQHFPLLQQWVFKTPRGFMGPVVMDKEVAEILTLLKSHHPSWESCVWNPLDHYQDLFKECRRSLGWMVVGLLLCFGAVLALWKGLNKGFEILKPLICGLGATFGGVVLIHPGISMFSVMGFILITCLGIDYALFLGTSRNWEGHGISRVLLANALCAFTTILSFGLLIFAHTPAVQDFGRVVFLGILMNVLLTTFFLGARPMGEAP